MEMVTTVSFEITTYDYASPDYGKWTFPHDFHYVYILENGRDAYVGETNDIIERSIIVRMIGVTVFILREST